MHLPVGHRSLGRTGLTVSAIALGTVELGLDYGIEAPGGYGKPSQQEAKAIVRMALENGINLFDTAPAYGESEALLGQVLDKSDAIIATKVNIPRDEQGHVLTGKNLRRKLEASLATSIERLKRDHLDIVQIHNVTTVVLEQGEITEYLLQAKQQGMLRHLGASVYTVDEALAVIASGHFDVLQVAYNLLDCRMSINVFPSAQAAGIGIISRSAFLKGVLTDKWQYLPPALAGLKETVLQVRNRLDGSCMELREAALRFCLSHEAIATVLVGVRTASELEQALVTARQGALTHELREKMACVRVNDEWLLNPANWPVT
ncbi:MAG: aldo/keto reductase [Desulfomonilia bacterium]|jgi:aryl-alcohol dehydrogenase-like predicted oxidoreductase